MALIHVIRIAKMGIANLTLRKMRSGLTMLGVIFGVCSVIAMLAIGEGASFEAQEAIKKLGSDNIILRSIKPPEENRLTSGQRSFAVEYGLTYNDAARVQETVLHVRRVLPMRIILDNVRFNQSSIPSQIVGTHPIYAEIVVVEIIRGRFLTGVDETHMDNVCVLSVYLAEQLFPYQDPLDQEVRVGADYYRVVGLVRDAGAGELGGARGGEAVLNNMYIPLSTAKSRFGETLIRRTSGSFQAERVQLHQLTVQLNDVNAVDSAILQIQSILQRFHHRKDYEMIVPLELLRQAAHTKRIFNVVLGSIAAISLLVGGIGIMNIMLATVTERTREIGIRRALGARRKDIVFQFLVETVALSVAGGLMGVVLGVLVPVAVSHLAAMKTIVTSTSLLIAFGISAAVGIIFGIYPASRAAALDPIQALRHE
jgi:putative ABC transport system permease protein